MISQECIVKFRGIFQNDDMIGLLCPSPSIPQQLIDAIMSSSVKYTTTIKNPQGASITVNQPLPFYLCSNAPNSVYDCLSHPIAIISIISNKEELADINFQVSNFFNDKPAMDINCLEYAILYNGINANVNYMLNDINNVPNMLQHFYSQLYPFIEAMLHNLHEQVGAIRRGLTGRFFSTTRKIWKSTGSEIKSNILSYLDPELQTRRLADLSYFINDLPYSLALYDTLKRDFMTDNKIDYASHCESMLTLIHAQSNSPILLDPSQFSLFVYHQQPLQYLMSLIKILSSATTVYNVHILIQVILKCKSTNMKINLLIPLLPLLRNRLQMYIAILLLHLQGSSPIDSDTQLSINSVVNPILKNINNPFLVPHILPIFKYINDPTILADITLKCFPFLTTFDQFQLLLSHISPDPTRTLSVPFPKCHSNIILQSNELFNTSVHRTSNTVQSHLPAILVLSIFNPFPYKLSLNNIRIQIDTVFVSPINDNNVQLASFVHHEFQFQHAYELGSHALIGLFYDIQQPSDQPQLLIPLSPTSTNTIQFKVPLEYPIIANQHIPLSISFNIPKMVFKYEYIVFDIDISTKIACTVHIRFDNEDIVMAQSEFNLVIGNNKIPCKWYITSNRHSIQCWITTVNDKEEYTFIHPIEIKESAPIILHKMDNQHYRIVGHLDGYISSSILSIKECTSAIQNGMLHLEMDDGLVGNAISGLQDIVQHKQVNMDQLLNMVQDKASNGVLAHYKNKKMAELSNNEMKQINYFINRDIVILHNNKDNRITHHVCHISRNRVNGIMGLYGIQGKKGNRQIKMGNNKGSAVEIIKIQPQIVKHHTGRYSYYIVKAEIEIFSDLMALDGIVMTIKNMQLINTITYKINGQRGVILVDLLLDNNGVHLMEMEMALGKMTWRQTEEIYIQ